MAERTIRKAVPMTKSPAKPQRRSRAPLLENSDFWKMVHDHISKCVENRFPKLRPPEAAKELADAIYARLDLRLHDEVAIVVRAVVNDISWSKIYHDILQRNEEFVRSEAAWHRSKPWWKFWR